MILLSHPTGNAFVRALLATLHEAGLLGQFETGIAVRGSEPWLRWLPSGWRREALRRHFDLPADRLVTHPAMELARLAALRAGVTFLTRHEQGRFSVDAVYQAVDRAVAEALPQTRSRRDIRAVYAYEDGALETFRAARRLGLGRVYDLPIAYWETSRRLMEEEQQRMPHWRITMEALWDSQEKVDRKTEELALAEVVVCPSDFVRDTLPAAAQAGKTCLVAPFGSPPLPPGEPARRPRGGKLRVLFAGSMSQRKGLADLFGAMKQLNRSDVELVVFGSPVAPMPFYRHEYADFIHEPPRPHAEVLRLMETCDVLVLPSIVEGRALVQQEALSRGLPVIVTRHAGGADLVVEGETGFLVPIRSPEAIAEKLDWLASNREALEAMRPAARRMAAARSWEAYGAAIAGLLRKKIAETGAGL